MSGTITAIILAIFTLGTVVLVQARQLMREIAHTAEEWRKLKRVLRSKNADVEYRAEEDQNSQ